MTPNDTAPDPLPPPEAPWLQVNVAFTATPGAEGSKAGRLFARLVPQFDAWHRAGRLHAWFFMRKPPGLRLRLCVAPGDDAVAAAVDAELAGLRGPVREHWWSNYAPELQRFGGSAAIAAVHAYFHADSRLWFALDQIEGRGLCGIAPAQWLPALFEDLFAAGGDDAARVAAWRQLAVLIADGAPATPPTADAASVAETIRLSDAQTTADPEAAALLRSHAGCNARLVARLDALARRGSLVRPLPQVLAEVALFGFNRHGFAGSVSAPLVARALAAARADDGST